MSPRSRGRALEIAATAAFAIVAAWLFDLGDERGGSLPFFLGWVAVHVLYGFAGGSFWTLLVVIICPPLFVAGVSGDWLEAAFVGLFYGVPFAFAGVIGRRLWELRRQSALLEDPRGENASQ